ncbi:MAG TPA: DUF1540 domain-containing protein [Ruminococcaceae bacterium]|nr:DUF1540 domain-containing protein [Oscillospiraceae bacterium]
MKKDKITESNHIKGIKCDVTNCHYNDKQQYCTADEVHIGPQFATCAADTVCASFKPE